LFYFHIFLSLLKKKFSQRFSIDFLWKYSFFSEKWWTRMLMFILVRKQNVIPSKSGKYMFLKIILRLQINVYSHVYLRNICAIWKFFKPKAEPITASANQAWIRYPRLDFLRLFIFICGFSSQVTCLFFVYKKQWRENPTTTLIGCTAIYINPCV